MSAMDLPRARSYELLPAAPASCRLAERRFELTRFAVVPAVGPGGANSEWILIGRTSPVNVRVFSYWPGLVGNEVAFYVRASGAVMKCLGRVFGLACSWVSLAVYATTPLVPVTQAATAKWMPHDIIVGLRDLPKRYSCNDLWYRLRDVLLAIGARADIQILPYRCEAALGANGRSPKIHLQFETLKMMHGTQVNDSDSRAVIQTVHLAAGEPHSLDQGDCELLRQLKDTLLISLNLRIVDFNLACSVPQNVHAHFGISVQAVLPSDKAPLHAALHP